MNDILIMLHFFGLAAGFASGIGNAVVMQLIGASPADAPVLGKIPPILARIGQTGLAVLWITGIILVWTQWGGPGNLPPVFWVKLALVVVFTGLIVMMGITAKRIAAGDRSAASRMPLYGRVSGGIVVLIVIFAVLAFH
jgi:hypothetical protein